jgi:F-type H+-transporting ATPase subunit epsilon
MSHILQLEIVTPVGNKFTGKVSEVTAPGSLGEMGVLPGHIPTLTVLDIGQLSFIDAQTNDTKHMAVAGGYLQVNEDHLILLTETAEYDDEVDVERASASKERAEKALQTEESGSATFHRKLRSLKRAETRLAVANRGHQ